MLAVIAVLTGVLAILIIAEALWRYELLRGEYQRKFLHSSIGTFAAFWPWLIGWEATQWLAAAMLVTLYFNRQFKVFHFMGGVRYWSRDYGDIALALGIMLCALLTDVKIFYTLAILHVSLADGLAAVIGTKFGSNWSYRIVGNNKTVIGTMTFWFVSLCILGAGMLFAYDLIPYNRYALLLLALPPTLAFLENITGLGFDNTVIPIATLYALHLAQTV